LLDPEKLPRPKSARPSIAAARLLPVKRRNEETTPVAATSASIGNGRLPFGEKATNVISETETSQARHRQSRRHSWPSGWTHRHSPEQRGSRNGEPPAVGGEVARVDRPPRGEETRGQERPARPDTRAFAGSARSAALDAGSPGGPSSSGYRRTSGDRSVNENQNGISGPRGRARVTAGCSVGRRAEQALVQRPRTRQSAPALPPHGVCPRRQGVIVRAAGRPN